MRRLVLCCLLVGCGADAATNDGVTPEVGAETSASTDAEREVDAPANEAATDTAAAEVLSDALDADSGDAGCTRGKRGTWAWGSDIVTKTADRAAFFDFAAKQGIGTVYVEAEGLFGASADPPALGTFVEDARARCVDVELLFGNANWLKTANHDKAVGLAKAAVAFAKAHAAKGSVIGVHWDIEAHQLAEWHDPYDAADELLLGQYLDLLEKLAAITAGSGQLLVVDIPFWYDNRQVTRAGKRRLVSELVLDLVDVATLMDYRDTADGTDGIIANAKTELAYATSVKKRVVVGVETLCGLTPTFITFCEEGRAKMDAQLTIAEATCGKEASFAGFAIHHYASWAGGKP